MKVIPRFRHWRTNSNLLSLSLRCSNLVEPLQIRLLSLDAHEQLCNLRWGQTGVKQAQVRKLPFEVTLRVQVIPSAQINAAIKAHGHSTIKVHISSSIARFSILILVRQEVCSPKHSVHKDRIALTVFRSGGQGDHVPVTVSQINMPRCVSFLIVAKPAIRIQPQLRLLPLVDIARVLHDRSDDSVSRVTDFRHINLNLVWIKRIEAIVIITRVRVDILECASARILVLYPKVHSEWTILRIRHWIKRDEPIVLVIA